VIEDLDATLEVRVCAGSTMSVRLSDTSAVEVLGLPGPQLVIRGRQPSTKGRVEILLAVPAGTAMALHNVAGVATIGDIDGPLELDTAGALRLRAGRVGETTIRVDGAADIEIAQITGRRLDVDVSGPARVHLKCDVTRIRARVRGSGDVLCGSADEAELSVYGSGSINVHRIRYSLVRHCVGSGEARVAVPPAPLVDRSSCGRPESADKPLAAH
jgi:hypothetical protein